jgi:hypothetical protein
MRRRLASRRPASVSNLWNRGTTLITSHRQRWSKRVILGHAGGRTVSGPPRVSE